MSAPPKIVAWRPVLAVVLPVVAVILLASSLLDLWPGEGHLVIVDGVAENLDSGPLAWAELALTVMLWLVGLVAGAWTAVRGVGPVEALGQGVKHLPWFVTGLITAGGATFLAMWAPFVVAPGPIGLVLSVSILLAAVFLTARLLISGVDRAVGGSGRDVTWGETALFLLGGILGPALFAWGAGFIPYVGTALSMTVALTLQAVLAARPHTREEAHGTRARIWPGAALIAFAVAVSAGLVVVNPSGAPQVRTHDRGPATATAVVWPAGQHPVIVTSPGVWYCDDDLCRSFTNVNGGPPTTDGYSRVVIAADGTVVKARLSGGPDKGGPFVHYARCTRDGCREAWLPVRASAKEKLSPMVEAEVAGASAPDGSLWFFVAAPVEGGQYGRYRFSLIRCADVACSKPQRHQVGVTDRTPEDGYQNGTRASLTVGADGRPAATFWVGHSLYRYGCEPVTCASPKHTADVAPPEPDSLNATTVVGSTTYEATAVPAPAPGFHLTIGESRKYWRQMVSRCVDGDCVSSPMDAYEGDVRRPLLAVAEDGRVLVVREDRVVLLEKPLG
ncbi:hypothetical protein JIG36_09085 [Actinoplanes sp. LDG1-06]|uniref:Uncharacterized protein n=1 Tax=Paractinoplanes ovalisporus TaxID=2810368 RepID=A0ABS2A7B1_9ACTN|nr:hypothetical protein [Actinoplanes ovalisporus]MBM2615706.1 hypothetical protein [Actinoplanes ovalisporus]